MIKLVIFDFDGVIADTLELAVRTVNNMLSEERYDEKIGIDDIREKGLKKLIREFRVPIYKVPFYIKKSHEIVGQELGSVRAFSGIRKMLKELKRHYKLAMVTSNSKENISRFIKKNGMEGIFEFIIAEASLFGKSSKMKKAVKTAGVSNEEAICVGDEVRDIDAARKAGLKIIAVSWGFNSERLIAEKKPDYLVRKPSELLSLIKSI